jgi:hypothetical protein
MPTIYMDGVKQHLPMGSFKFLTDEEIAAIDFTQVPDSGDVEYVAECDLAYPDELHKLHYSFPLAPEHVLITKELLSPYCKSFQHKHVDCQKLVATLNNRYLKLYFSLGMKLTKICRVVSFCQSDWMRPFVEFCTMKRQNAQSTWEKRLWKSFVCSAYGKMIENVRRRKNIQLVSDVTIAKKLISKPQLEQFRIINGQTVLIDRIKTEVTLDKPIYSGFCILELSKILIFDFHCNVILNKYGRNAQLLFSDTDSLCYHIKIDDLYKDMLSFKDAYLNTSNYPREHFLYSDRNALVVGKMKDECSSLPALEFVGLR